MAKPIGKPRRPILSRGVIASLDSLARSTPATDETETALRYIRHLVAFENLPERIARKAEVSAAVQESKRRTRAAIERN